jgi:hypothetical protein
MPEPLLNNYCWRCFNTWDNTIESEEEYFEEMYGDEPDVQGALRLRERLDALIAAADTDAGLGKVKFGGPNDDYHSDQEEAIIDLTGLTNKQVMNALAEFFCALVEDDEDAMGDHTHIEFFNEEGNFWRISWGS